MTSSRGRTSQGAAILFTMLLFLVFLFCAMFTVFIGGKVYENISTRMEQSYTDSIALHYVANKVRQADAAGSVCVIEKDGISVLELSQEIDGECYLTWIYYLDGSIRELFTWEGSGLSLEDGLEILVCDGMEISQEGQLVMVKTMGAYGGNLTLSLRSEGGGYE